MCVDTIFMFCPRTFNSFSNFCRIGIDEWLRVPSVRDVYAIGDCSGFLENTGKDVLPALAQVVSYLDTSQTTKHAQTWFVSIAQGKTR